jgi:hypothetical protein
MTIAAANIIGQPGVERIQRDRQDHAPRQDAYEGTNKDEAPDDKHREHAKAEGDLDHLLARPVLPKWAQWHFPPSIGL